MCPRHSNEQLTVMADGLAFLEDPVALPEGDMAVAEIAAGRVTRLCLNGRRSCVAQIGGGPNGLALGPGALLGICNNGGCITWTRHDDGRLVPRRRSPDYDGGRIEVPDPAPGRWERLYDRADGLPLLAPNDLVCYELGGFWFSDHGLPASTPAEREGQGICYSENAICNPFEQWPVSAFDVAACRFDVRALAANVGGNGGGA